MEVVPSRQCGPLLKTLSPLPASLEHLKRVRPRPDEGLVEVIISDGATGDASGEERWVPDRMPVTLAQFDAWKGHWPLTFRRPSWVPHEIDAATAARFARGLARAEELAASAKAAGFVCSNFNFF